jgi:hypothetical protein
MTAAAHLWAIGYETMGKCLAVDYVCHGGSWFVIALAERKPRGKEVHP